MMSHSKFNFINFLYHTGIGCLFVLIIFSMLSGKILLINGEFPHLMPIVIALILFPIFSSFFFFFIGAILFAPFRKKLLNKTHTQLNQGWFIFSSMGTGFIALFLFVCLKQFISPELTIAHKIGVLFSFILFPFLAFLTGKLIMWLYKKLLSKPTN